MTRSLLALFASIALANQASAQTKIDVAIVGVDRPAHIRLQLDLDGRPLEKAWRSHIDRWFRFIDRDNDGILSEDELLKAPPPAALLQGMRQGNVVYVTGLGVPGGNFGDKRTPNADEFAKFYMENGAGPISTIPIPPQADGVSDRLFKLLDTDKDGKLSRAEIEAAEKVLWPFDVDDDETVALTELFNPFGNNFRIANPVGMMKGPAGPQSTTNLILLAGKGSTQAILDRHDEDKNGTLDRKEFAIDEKLFAKLDQNGDGVLDATELAGWASLPPDAEWTASWSKNASTSPNKPLSLGDAALGFVFLPRQPGTMYSPAQYLLQFFQTADTAKKGYLEEADVKLPQFQLLKQNFALLDRDKDGKLTEAEVKEFVELMADGLGCHVTMSFTDAGRGLFGLMDADRDGRLSVRELRSAWSRMEPLDRDKDGFVEPREIPRQCTLAAGVGFTALAFRPGIGAPAMAPRPAYPVGTPTWFIKMDVNGDGEISRREFLGSAADFRRLDANGDGAISAEEAMRKE